MRVINTLKKTIIAGFVAGMCMLPAKATFAGFNNNCDYNHNSLILREAGVIESDIDKAVYEEDTQTACANQCNVDSHSITAIRMYYNSHGASDIFSNSVTYKSKPVTSGNYSAGELSDATKKNALSTLNFIRYIAGVPANVTLNSDYSKRCQAGCLVNAVNGVLTHYPSQPDDMNGQLYETGLSGTSASNIAMGFNNLSSATFEGWLFDTDEYNLPMIGHRRWMLNPYMGQTGFGMVGYYSSMYAFDTSNTSGSSYSNVAWPAKNTPVKAGSNYIFMPNSAWTLSTDDVEDASKVKVTLTCTNNNKKWTFSSSGSNGDFYVNNDGYGQTGCIIFKPSGNVTYNAGDKYTVKIEGLVDGTLTYPVNFFNLNTSITTADVTLSATQYVYDGKAKNPTVTVKLSGTTLKAGTDYYLKRTSNVQVGTSTIQIVGKGCYTGTITKTFKIIPATPVIGSVENSTTGVTIKWGKVNKATTYNVYRKLKGTSSYTKIGSSTGTSYIDKKAVSGKEYYYELTAVGGGVSSKTSSAKTIKYLAAGKISNIYNVASGVTLNWSKVNGALGYQIYRKTGSGKYEKIASVSGVNKVAYTDTKIRTKNLTSYTYAVRPYYSTTLGSFEAKQIIRLTIPSGLKAKSNKKGTIDASWDRTSGVTGYVLKVQKGNVTKTVNISGSTTVSKRLSSLTAGTYTVYVRTMKKSGGVTSYSAWKSVSNVVVR